MDSLLRYKGSLLNDNVFINAPYDVSKKKPDGRLVGLNSDLVLNNSIKNVDVDYSTVKNLNVINGMGVTLGDSIVGISVLHMIKEINPNINICVLRPSSAPQYVEEIYRLASTIIDELSYMPFDIRELDGETLNIDVGNQLFWPSFHTDEMHDFFMDNLGVKYPNKFNNLLSNSWMQSIKLDPFILKNYVLFSPLASTQVRSIPKEFYIDIVDMLFRRTGKTVVGFVDVEHPAFINISAHSTSTREFISIIKNADFLYTSDSSALHIAAAFKVPTECVFTTIKPSLRTKYYPLCKSHFIGNDNLLNVQNSEEPALVSAVQTQFKEFFYG